MKKKIVAVLLCATMIAGMAAGCGSSDKGSGTSSDGKDMTELTLLIDTDVTTAGFEAVAKKAEEKLGIKVNIETRPGGADGDNIVKTRLASGDMADLCLYNSGALLNALNPAEYFIDISGEDFVSRIDDNYKSAVSVGDKVFGVPYQSAQAEGIVYSKPMYEKYNLEIPKTWDEFLANCDVLKENGETAILGTYADSWTAQVPFLGDAYNLEQSDPEFAEKFDAGEAKWATTPAALRSFEKLADTTEYYNSDYLATTYDDGCDIMANGEAGHWFILSQALSNIYELYQDQVNDLGVFAVPGDSAEDNGITLWYPAALYGNKNSDKTDAILKFMEFYISDEALDAYSEAVLPDGPYCVKGYEMPDNAYDPVANDIQAYFESGKNAPALEYISQVKGADCPAICQELGSGQTTAKEAAEKYDKDCAKQATQLGLDW
ncbi:ABC transporter substrate-binding protein [Faecalicatena orotica]